MKKFLCVLLAMVLMCATLLAFAETVAFDKSKLTGSELYRYDKFSREWNIQGHYVKEYRDASVTVSLLLFDVYVEEGWGPEVRVEFFDKETQQYDKVTAFRAIVGEKMFCFESLEEGTNVGYAFGGNVLEALCEALLAGGEVAFQIDHTDKYGTSWTATIDPVDRTDLSDLIAMATLLKNSNAWSASTAPEIMDIIFGATME